MEGKSCSTSTGRSLNDVLLPGPKLQNDLTAVVTRWRRWTVAFCADIKMMFRQILVNPEDTQLQRIVWSPSADVPEIHYALQTVTYGESCAPYLALRTLKQLCSDEGGPYPEATKAIEQELYVDDFLCGADSVAQALRRRDQLIELLQAGGFQLKKWVCNAPDLLEDLPPEDCLRPKWPQLAAEGPVHELGILWDPAADHLRFAPPLLDDDALLTKRQVLAEIARLFDPAGWLAPVVVLAKMFMQDLWRAGLDWDHALPESMARQWQDFRTNLRDISTIKLSRWLCWTPASHVQLHAFADASRRACAAVVYLRAEGGAQLVNVTLVMAKTKLAPMRGDTTTKRPPPRMTIPRLELRAALLAARLLHICSDSLGVPPCDCFAWSDSRVVLHWLQSEGPLGNDFADNYVSQVQEILPHCQWRYVNTKQNPADIATRGSDPLRLSENSLWWSGPEWLSALPAAWPSEAAQPSPAPVPTHLTCHATQVLKVEFADIFSNLDRLLKTLVRCR